MSVITSSLKNLSSFLQDHQVSFSNGLLILFTIGGEQIFRFNAFQCPCAQPEAMYYAIIFMAVPAIILGILGIVVSNLTWRVCHGCCHRSKEEKHGKMKATGRIIEVIGRAIIVPCAWLFVTLLDGNYYACMMASTPCNTTSPEYLHWVTVSQNISWFSLLGVVVFAFLVITFTRCFDSVTFSHYKYISSYREAEQDQFDLITKKHAEDLAKENITTFIERPVLSKQDWDAISVTPDYKISDLDDSSLTPLHQWIKNLPPNVQNVGQLPV